MAEPTESNGGPFGTLAITTDRQLPWYVIAFDKEGACTSRAARAHLLDAARQGLYDQIFYFSHGWNNVFADVQGLNERLLQALGSVLPEQHGLDLARMAVVSVFWPSVALLTTAEQGPQLAGDATTVQQLIDLFVDEAPPADRDRLRQLATQPELNQAAADELARLLVALVRSDDEMGCDALIPDDLLAIARRMALPPPQTSGEIQEVPDDVDPWGDKPNAAGNLDQSGRQLLRYATVYMMQKRAGIVGSRGVCSLLHDLLALPDLRLHLGGHSYGCRVMLAALCSAASPRAVESLLLLQPAVSRYCFAEKVPKSGRPGGYVRAPERVRQPIMLTYSKHDKPLHQYFGLAMHLKGEVGEPNPAGLFDTIYAALGGYGPSGITHQDLTIKSPGDYYPISTASARIIAVNGALPISETAHVAINDHGDVTNRYTAWMLYNQLRLSVPTPTPAPTLGDDPLAATDRPVVAVTDEEYLPPEEPTEGPFQINAWTGTHTVRDALLEDVTDWIEAHAPKPQASAVRPEPLDLRDWRAARWGVILPYNEAISHEQQAFAADAPEPLQQLIRDRDGLVLRYKAASRLRHVTLFNPATGRELAISEYGEDDQRLPAYLLIYATPAAIPWKLQFMLNSAPQRFVGRLDLTGAALERYITALRSDWADAATQVDTPLIWAVDHGAHDITRLMRNAIAARLYRRYAADDDLGPRAIFLDGQQGQGGAEDLIRALDASRPNLIVTTSHGMTGPLDDRVQMQRQLGWLVDQTYEPLDPERLLANWQPDGAIWYAHACCSAGSMGPSAFADLVPPGGVAHQVLHATAALGDQIAPLPRALLGATKPLRAFIGHVEPTFDYTLQMRGTYQFLTGSIIEMLNERAFSIKRYPVGMMTQTIFNRLGLLASQEREKRMDQEQRAALYFQLCFHDVQSTVILGDPTVAPKIPTNGS
ncbi:MAG: hypothetical protein EI684_05955 [Candidatus Viridilinea halotolerans]|uniref:Uncharacterized protein n=1 Tax=Candidatus Viridilinea halotolerans TaxID=2491704 RepID=A0A426U4S5_9CHLR|nr:MAG: hypothetical protein EI684_05955 [Candidatus Viridilinea halotolerans]